MPAEPRLLLLGPTPVWFPPLRNGRLLVGSAPTADARLPDSTLPPFVCLVEAAEGRAVLVHDLGREGEVRDIAGKPAPRSGLLVRPGERFGLGPFVVAVLADTEGTEASDTKPGRACLVCGSPEGPGGGRAVCDAFVCTGCLGVFDLPADALPGYELVARLGSGSMGSVFLARQTAQERLVAMKVLHPGQVPGTGLVTRFLREIRVLGGLRHPHVVRVLDAGAVQGRLYLASELVRGGDALARLRALGPRPPAEVARIGVELSTALAYAHSAGVIHRDVKPANVFLELDGTAKLGDFGLAKDLTGHHSGGATTGSGAVLGTVAYAAPEQLGDGAAAGPAADVWGLGATLFHLATGRTPREGIPLPELARRRKVAPPPADQVRSSVPRELAAVLERTMRTTAEERPTPVQLGELLRPLLETIAPR